MQMDPNVQIPLALFREILFFFDSLSLGGYSIPAIYKFDRMHAELRAKQDKINLRAAYSNSIIAKGDDQRRIAYLNYQRLKNKR
jgi:hypothetical protein